MYLPPFRYCAPASVDEALDLLRRHLPDAKLLAGGQSLLPLMSLGLARPAVLIDLNGLADSARVTDDGGNLRIGALTRHHTLETSAAVRERCPLLAEAASLIGNIRVRHRGTIGGSLAHADPAAELPIAALALDATLEVRGPAGSREVPAGEFFRGYLETALAPDEIVTGVRVPAPNRRQGHGLAELTRRAGDFALVAACAVLEVDAASRCARASLALGGVGPRPVRIGSAEALLVGHALTASCLDRAAGAVADQVAPESDVHASAAYRRQMARVMARRALGAAVARLTNGGAPDGDARAGGRREDRPADPADGAPPERGRIQFHLNGAPVEAWAAPCDTLLAVLRDGLGATEVKYGCGEGVCGTCTVLLDEAPVNACLVLGVQARGRAVTTVKGLGGPQGLHPLQRAFIEHEAAQCGFCTPGMLLAAHAFLRDHPAATREEIRAAVAGNLCRCTGYTRIVDAIESCARGVPRGAGGGRP